MWAQLSCSCRRIWRSGGDEIGEPPHVINEIRQADLGSGAGESDGSYKPHVLVILLCAEDMFDTDAGFAAFVVAAFQFGMQLLSPIGAVVDFTDLSCQNADDLVFTGTVGAVGIGIGVFVVRVDQKLRALAVMDGGIGHV